MTNDTLRAQNSAKPVNHLARAERPFFYAQPDPHQLKQVHRRVTIARFPALYCSDCHAQAFSELWLCPVILSPEGEQELAMSRCFASSLSQPSCLRSSQAAAPSVSQVPAHCRDHVPHLSH